MPRYALKIEYNGAPFSGWQRQKNAPSVQQSLEEALRALDPEVPTIFAAGRTDTGVHATGQVAHCEMTKAWDGFRLQEALNYHLRPAPISVLQARPVSEAFHARFSALERRYLFRLISRRAPLTHDKGLAWRVNHTLNVTAMQDAAHHLIGKHDFTTFRASHCQAKSPIKSINEITISHREIPEGHEYRLEFRARSFLHNQVRSIVGTLERVGAGAWAPERVKTALKACNRAACGPVCSPDGLYLTHVEYPENPFL